MSQAPHPGSVRLFPPPWKSRTLSRSRLVVSGLWGSILACAGPLGFSQTNPATLPDLKLSNAGLVRALAAQPDGTIIIAGFFVFVDDTPRFSLARLKPNGSLDRSWSQTPMPPKDSIKAVAVSGSNVYLAGGLIAPAKNGGNGKNGLARVNLVNGALDFAWGPTNINGSVDCLAVDGTNVYFGGHFDMGSGMASSNLARVSIAGNGALDTSWTASANGTVQRMVLDGTNLFIAGQFLTPGTNLAKLSAATGAVDANWSPPVALLGTGNFTGLAISETNLYVANDFTNGTPSGLLKLSTAGAGAADTNWNPALDATWPAGNSNLAITVSGNNLFVGGLSGGKTFLVKADAGHTGGLDTSWSGNAQLDDAGNAGAEIRALAANSAALFVGGSFITSGGSISLGLTKLDLTTGLRREDFPAQVQIPGKVNVMARQADGRLLLGGAFQVAGGLARRNLARLSSEGAIDTTWAPDAVGEVFALAISGTNVFVGGQFTKAGGKNRINLAKIGIANTDAADGAWDAGISNAAAAVTALAVGGTNLFVGGGRFGTIGRQTRNGLAKLNVMTGDADPMWNPDPKWPISTKGGIDALLLADDELFVGGLFTITNRNALAKVSTTGAGGLIPGWNPRLLPTNDTARVVAMVLNQTLTETNLFIGGSFTNVGQGRTNLAKLASKGAGQVDLSWNPTAGTMPSIQSLAVQNQDLLVGGAFTNFAGLSLTNLVRVGTVGAGVVDNSFSPNPDAKVLAVHAEPDRDVFVGGEFTTIGGVSRSALAFMTVAGAPVFIQDTETNVFLTRNPFDGPEITHFKITAISNGTLYQSDGLTQINQGDFLTVAQGEAGLKFLPGLGGVLKAVAAVNATTAGAGTKEGTLTMVANPSPVVKFDPATYSVREGDGNVIVTVRKYGAGATDVYYFTRGASAIANQDFQPKTNTLSFSTNDSFKNIVITIADDLHTQGDRLFFVTLTNAAIVAGPLNAEITILDNDIVGASDSVTATALPTNQPASDGVLTVSMQPASALWRLQGELYWHASGANVSGLVKGNYRIEFHSLAGYSDLDAVTVPVYAGTTNAFFYSYLSSASNPTTGKLTMTIEPSEVASATSVAMRGQWRREGETNWHDNGDIIASLSSDYYTIEFKPVSGWTTPLRQIIQVGADAEYGSTATYLLSATSGVLSPTNVEYAVASMDEPYLFNGQLETAVGFSSGFVVKRGVVLTVGHALFDDDSLSYVTTALWFFQRYRDEFEPVPQTPRGWYIFDGYATQREADNTPGISTQGSQELDAAALYFLEDAGRGGYGGFLSSDAANNEFLLSDNYKFLVGFPLEGVAETNQGKLHATTPMNLAFTNLYKSVFATTDIQSFPGNSGGPLYVLNYVDNTNRYLPAGIYLGGSGETLVRAIDSSIVDLINRADDSSHGGGNSTGGGPVSVNHGDCSGCTDPYCGTLTVNLLGAKGQSGWRFPDFNNNYNCTAGSHPEGTNYVTSTPHTVRLFATAAGEAYRMEFKPVMGYLAPSNISVTIGLNGVTTVDATYVMTSSPLLLLDAARGLGISSCVSSADILQIQYAPQLPATNWSVLTNVTLQMGTNWILNTTPASATNRFYRAIWSTN